MDYDVKRSQPVVIDTVNPLKFPPFCACCGQPTKKTIKSEPIGDGVKASQDFLIESLGLIVHPIGLITGLAKLAATKPRIPICRTCWLKHFLPSKKTIVFILLHILFFVDAFYHGFQSKFGYMFVDLFLAMVCLAFVARKNMRHSLITFPIRIFLYKGMLRYVIYDGPFYDRFSK